MIITVTKIYKTLVNKLFYPFEETKNQEPKLQQVGGLVTKNNFL